MAERKRRVGDEKEAFWRGVVEGFAGSGLTVRAHCAAAGVSEPSFFWWRRELARRASAPKPAAGRPPLFVPLAVAEAAAEPAAPELPPKPHIAAGVEVRLRGGRVLRLTGPVDRRLLGELLAALEAAPC
jgi:hypothetical protein